MWIRSEERRRVLFRSIGWTDSPLSKRGKLEIGKLQACLTDYEMVLASDLQRCVDTAHMLFPAAVIQTNPLFREMNWGVWEGKTYEQLQDEVSYQQWLASPMEAAIPEGERYPVFSKRVALGWQQLYTKQFAKMALVTHGGVIRELLVRYAPEEKSFWDWSIAHASGYELVWDSVDLWRRGARCTSLRAVPIMEKING